VGSAELLSEIIRQQPGFLMAHVLLAYLSLGSRDPQRVQAARPVLARATQLPANERERAHLCAIESVLADDYEQAKTGLGDLLRQFPRDVLALQMVHSFDYVTGASAPDLERFETLLPEWSSDISGYGAVQAMYGFALVENGKYERAEQAATTALLHDPRDARAHHVMAHVFEMTGRPAEGAHWMKERVTHWNAGTLVATHCWWHLALFHLAQAQVDRALELYDTHFPAHCDEVADLFDATSLLWRIKLLGRDTERRFAELARAWTPHIEDGFCSFNDVHAALAFVGASDGERGQRLERALSRAQHYPTRHGKSTRELGLPACRALLAFGRHDYALAISLLADLPSVVYRLGGSHAQLEVMHLTLLKAVEHVRRPRRYSVEAYGNGFAQPSSERHAH
jgi:tetratricopeptide (TPR) repeat protein